MHNSTNEFTTKCAVLKIRKLGFCRYAQPCFSSVPVLLLLSVAAGEVQCIPTLHVAQGKGLLVVLAMRAREVVRWDVQRGSGGLLGSATG